MDTLELSLVRPKTALASGEQLLVVTGLYDSASMKRPALTSGEGVRLLYDQAVVVAELAFDANGQVVARN